MSPPPEEMISWVLEELALSGVEGIPISNLFDSANAHLYSTSASALDVATKDNLWKSLVAREDVFILDEEAGIVKSLAYQDLLGTELGKTKVNIQSPLQPLAPNGQHTVQTKLSPTTNVTSTQAAQTTDSSVVPSIEEHSAARASLDPREATPHSERASVQHTASPTPKATPRKRGTGPKAPVRKTSRRWTEKAKHISQEDIDKEEDAKQYAAGLARVYIDPPGSVRPVVSPPPQLHDEPKTTGPKNVKQKIAVFKSLCLTDPLWLVKKRGSWKEAFNQKKAELEGRTSVEPDVPPTVPVLDGAEAVVSRIVDTVAAALESSPQVPGAEASQPVDTVPAALESSSKVPDAKASHHKDAPPTTLESFSSVSSAKASHRIDTTTSAPKLSSNKRKARTTSEGNEPRKKRGRGRPRKTPPATITESQPKGVAAPLPPVISAISNGANVVQQPISQQPVTQITAAMSTESLLRRFMQKPPTSYKSPYSSVNGVEPNNSTQTQPSLGPTSPLPLQDSTPKFNAAQRKAQSDALRETIRPPPPVVARVPSQSTGTYQVPQNVQDPGFGFSPETLASNNTLPYAAYALPPSLPSSVQSQPPPQGPYRHQHPNQGHMDSQYIAGPLNDLPHEQQNWYAPFGHNVPPNFGSQIPAPYAGNFHGNSNAPLPYNGFSDWNGHFPQPQQPIHFQSQPRGPSLGYFGAPPPQRGLSTPTASTQAAPVSNERQKHAKERGSALSETLQSTQPPPAGRLPRSEHDPNYKPKLVAELETMEATLERFSAEAEAIEFPNVAARLFASYNNVVGNLVLSGDKTQLTFRALDQKLGPLLALHISQVTVNPIVSMKGSRPMELQVKYENETEDQVTCRFYIGQSDEAYETANVMRASIVTARIICRAANGETDTYELFKEDVITNMDIVKPFKCEKCNKRFKNREGIKYHREKSNTTCNPNFVPPTDPAKPKRTRKPKAQPKTAAKLPAKKAKTVNFVQKAKPDQRDNELSSVENDDSSDSVHDSDDSIFEWAEKVAFVNPGKTVRSAPPTPKKPAPKKADQKVKSSLLEEKILQKVVNEAISYTPPDETIDVTVENVLQELVEEVVNFSAIQEQLSELHGVAEGQFSGNESSGLPSLEQFNNQRSKNIILGLVNRNFGFFPGENGLWFSFVALWLQNHARSGVLPTSKLCAQALDQLVQELKLISTIFHVRENYSLAATRTFITLPTTALDSPPIDTLKELIKMAYPGYYVPSRFAPPAEVRESLEAFADGSSGSSTQKRRDYSKSDAVPREDAAYDSDYEYGFEDEQIVQSDENEDSEEGDSDRSYYDETPRKSKNSRQRAQRMKNHWAASKAAGSNVLIDLESSPENRLSSETPYGVSNQSRSRFGRPKAKPRAWKTGPIPVQEKERRKLMAANKMLNFAPTALQNEETGAWDQAPFCEPKQTVRTKVFKYRLPEVVTYLQSGNGAWTSRAYGHGSTPIFPRLQRRADGNPHLQSYLKRIEAGHRPIVTPNPNNRQLLPAVPSRKLLGTSLAKKRPYKNRTAEELAEAEERKRQYKKRKLSIISLPGDEDARPRRKSMKIKASIESTDDDEDTHPKRKYTKIKGSVEFTDDEEDAQSTLEQELESDEIQPGPKHRRTIILRTKRQQSVLETVDPDFHASVGPTNVAPPMTRRATRGGQDLDVVQMLGFFKPREFSDFEKSPNPGLVTLPVSFWVCNAIVSGDGGGMKSTSAPAAHNPKPGLAGIENITAWEQGPGQKMLENRTQAGGYLWVNHTVDAMESSFDTEMMKLKWDPNAAFKIEDLPYEIIDELDVEIVEAPAATKSQNPPPKKKKRSGPKKFSTRRLTAWPTDFDGVLDNLDSVRGELDVEMAPKLNPGLGRALDGTMTAQEEKRLLMAIIVITTLTGGVKESIDWVLIANNFPKYSPNYIKKAWGRLLKNEKAFVQTITSDFQEAFISAYETGEVPTIDYDNLVDYDWPKVINWAFEKIYRSVRNDISLPNTRKEMKNMYDIKVQGPRVDKAREMFFDSKVATYRRIDAISATAHTHPAQAVPGPKNADDIEIDEVTLARSWIKSLVLTPQEDYDVKVAQEKLLKLGEDLVDEVRKALLEEKVIMPANKGRAVPGRMYEPTDFFFSSLRKHIPAQRFIEAVEFKKFLDTEFASGKECVRSDYMANEGTILCVTNLQAHGRILLKGVNVPMNKMGLCGGGYETRKLPKETFRFDMDIYPTDSYIFDEDVSPLQKLEFLEPPRGGDAGEIPIWYGVTGNLIPVVWKRILVTVYGVASLRAGASVASLEKTLRPALEEWEIWRLMEWGVKVGFVKRIDESFEGWTMGEWWWAVVGRFCDINDEE